MVRISRPAVVANLTVTTPPGAVLSSPTPATPTTASEATARGGNHSSFSIRSIAHRGFQMVESVEDDGDGFTTPAYLAWRPSVAHQLRGETLLLSHPRFGFEPTQDWFEDEVDRLLDEQAQHKRDAYGSAGRDLIVCFGLMTVFAACGWVAAVLA